MAERIRVTVEELRLRNFRAFESARLQLSDLTYLVGRNGAGKSSLLDAIDLLRESVTDSLENALDRRGGLSKVRRLSVEEEPNPNPRMGVVLILAIELPGGRTGRACYGFELVGHPSQLLYIVQERLELVGAGDGFARRDREFVAPGRKLNVDPPAGNLVLPLVARSDSVWEQVLDTIRQLRGYELSPAHMATASEIGEKTTLVQDGTNAGDVLKALGSSAEKSWLVERLALLTDGIADVKAAALLGRRVLRFVQNHGGTQRELDATQISQGTLRGLGVLLALRQHPTPSLVLVDEIENSMHPNALGVLLDAALASCDRTRVVLTSHSPEVLSHPSVTGERVRLVEWRDGVSRVFRLSPDTQSAVNEIDTVGWMLRTNALWPGPEPETFGDDLFALDDDSA